MTVEAILEFAKGYKKGTYVNASFKSDLPVKAMYKKQGIAIEKHTSRLVRLGLDYSNIGEVKEYREAKGVGAGESWFVHDSEYVVTDKKTHTKKYLAMYKAPNAGKVTYWMNGRQVGLDEVAMYICPSYFNPSTGDAPNAIWVCKIENVLSLG